MQVLDTAIHARADGVLVEFIGEGGEKIAVTMAVPDPRLSLGDAALVDRAREMMVQCAAFGGLPDRPGQEGNPESGPSGVERPRDAGKDLYTFEYREGDSLRRLEGVELPNPDAVHDEALRSAMDLLDDASAGPWTGWAVRVRDGNGDIVLSVDFDEARRERAIAAT
jgi:hypothetical protein